MGPFVSHGSRPQGKMEERGEKPKLMHTGEWPMNDTGDCDSDTGHIPKVNPQHGTVSGVGKMPSTDLCTRISHCRRPPSQYLMFKGRPHYIWDPLDQKIIIKTWVIQVLMGSLNKCSLEWTCSGVSPTVLHKACEQKCHPAAPFYWPHNHLETFRLPRHWMKRLTLK